MTGHESDDDPSTPDHETAAGPRVVALEVDPAQAALSARLAALRDAGDPSRSILRGRR